MADNTVNVGINVSDNGTTGKVTQNVKELKNLLDQAAQSAAKIAMGGGTPAPRMAGGGSVPPSSGGAAAIASGGGARPPGGAASSQAEYGASRGVAGSTGASARDFAKESEGLSGLVRVYATFAANVYVAAAAFSALSKAMDTSNMVQGLNQLGAASGVSLGTLSKRLVDATDGAISLRQGMQSVAQASAAGISSNMILNLGEGAKKASQALGVDMSDALSRIMRGVTKLEPELLDEIGIFTKLDESTRKYAITLGKASGSLTDFERRQGFAIAVQDELNKKFGELKIDANPYSKLLATVQNLAQSGLELVNKVMVPIVGLLASAPMALAGVLGLIGINLLGKTIPALGKWQEGLKNAAEQAKNTSESVAKSFDTRFQTNLESRFKLPGLKQSLADAEKEFAKISAATFIGPMAAAPRNLGPSAANAGMDPKGLSTVNDLLTTRNTRLETGYAGAAKLSATQIQATKDEIKWLEAKAKAIEHEIALTAAAGKVSKEKAAIDIAQTKIGTIADKPIGLFDPQTVGLKQAEKARLSYEKLSAVAAASEMASTNGVRAAWAQLGTTIEEKGIKGIDKFTTLAKGGLAAVGTRLTGLIGAFGQWGMIAAAGVAIFEVFDSFASKNTKEVEATAKAFSVVKDAVVTLGDTMDNIAKKGFLGSFTTESRVAAATAITGLVTATQDAIDKAGKELLAANWWDTLKDKVSMLWGGDTASKVAAATAATVSKALKAAEDGPAKEDALQKLSTLLKIDASDAVLLEKALASADKALGKKSLDVADELSKKLQAAASAAAELDEAFKTASKTYDTIMISVIPTDPIAKLGQEMMIVGEKMQKAAKDPITALDQLAKISNDVSKLRFFSPEAAKDLLERTLAMQKLTSATTESKKAQEESTKVFKQNTNAAFNQPISRSIGKSLPTADTPARLGSTKAVADESKVITDAAQQAGAAIALPLQKTFKTEGVNIFARGAALIKDSIAKGFSEGKAILSAAYATRLGDTEAGIKARAQLAKDEIDRSILDLKAKEGLIDVQEVLRKAVEENTIETALNTLKMGQKNMDPTEYNKQKDTLEKQREMLLNPDPSAAPTAAKLAKQAIGSQIFKAGKSKDAIDVRTQDELAANRNKQDMQQLDTSSKVLASRKEFNKLIESGLPYITEETLKAQQKADIQAEDLLNTRELNDVNARMGRNQDTINKLAGKNIAEVQKAQEANAELMREKERIEFTQAEQKKTNDEKRANEVRTRTLNQSTFEQTLSARTLEIAQANDKTLASDKEATIAKLKDAGVNAAITLAGFQSDLDKKTESERLAAVIADLQSRKTAEVDAKTKLVAQTKGTPEGTVAQLDLTSTTTRYDALIASEKSISANKQISLDITARQSLEMATQAKLLADQKIAMDALVPVAESLSTIFGDVGKKFGDGMLGILKATQDAANARVAIDLKYAQDRKAIEMQTAADIAAAQDTMAPDMGASEELKGKKELAALEQKNAKDSANLEFAKNAKMISSFKNMFSEKTFAYKALANVEKVMHISKLAMEAKEMAMSLFADGKKLFSKIFTNEAEVVDKAASMTEIMAMDTAQASTSIATSIPAIFAKFSSQMGVWGWAAAAAVVAAIASMGGGGGAAPPTPAGMSAKDQQETQGTGQKYVNGVKTDTGGGVFGDSTAKSNAIEDSLAVIKATSVENMSSSSTMVDLLTSINKNIGAAAIQLFGVKGVTGGTGFGTTEGSSGSSFLGGLFGGSQSTEILNSGIKFIGSFTDLMQNITGAFQQFETVKTTSSSSFLWMSRTSSSISTAYKNLSDVSKKGAQALADTFNNAGKLFVEQGRKFGITETNIMKSLGDIKMSDEDQASLRGLKGEELSKALNAVISSTIDRTATLLFSNIVNTYRKFGETAEVTVTRVLDGNEKVNLALLSIGKAALNTGEVTTDSSIAISQAMIDAAGDLSTFLEETKFFRDNFVSATTKINATTTNLTERFTALGFTLPKTRKEFAALVDQFSGTDDAAINLHEKLMKLAPDMDALAQATEATSKLQIDLMEAEGNRSGALAARREIEYAALSDTDAALKRRIDLLNDEKSIQDTRFSQDQKIYALLGTEDDKRTALIATREKELDGLDNQLKAAQRYIYALEDEATARNKASSAINSTITSLKGSVKTLEDYRLTLVTGSSSLATPAQKYAALKQELTATQAAAMGPTDTPAQLAAQQAAAAKLPQVATAFLDQSKIMNASSDAYAQDLTNTQKLISDTIDSISGTQTLAERQLTALGPLANIETASVSTAKLMQDFLNASSLVPLARIGAAASGSVAAGGDAILSLPSTTTAPSLAIDRQAIANEALAAQVTETNRLLQLQIDQSRALAVANAALTKRISDDAIKAAQDLADSQSYSAATAPVSTTYEGGP